MRTHMIGLAAGLLIAAATGSQASVPPATGKDLLASAPSSAALHEASTAADRTVIARRGRGADDPSGDDNRDRGGGKANGGKGRGGHDDGPNHDRNDDHGPNHA